MANTGKEKIDKVNTIKGYDDLLVAKRSSALMMKVVVGFCVFVVVAVLFWAFSVHVSTVDKLKVIDRAGNVIPADLSTREKQLRAFVETHCSNTTYYLNSFDRLTIKENQSRALFLVNSNDANRIFSQFNTQNSYGDALTRGVVFETTYDKLLDLDITQEPYKVRFQSIMTIYDNNNKPERYLVLSEGTLVNHTAQYPENQVGLYFRTYRQEFKKLESDE
ncbi:hypothetical protein [Parapedobacter soli]|uniref:hypothetical protein n=1 Tax=Parapedobacter soli TaxID=416955 RepID=UPI0021C98630|nr:hypothetical protein [Parapedobacter soli]